MDDVNNTSSTGYQPSGEPVKKSKKTMVIWVIIAILVLALGGAGGYVWGQMGKQQEVDKAKETAKKEETSKQDDSSANDNKSDAKTPSKSNPAPAKTVTEPTCNADELTLAVAQGTDSGAGTIAYDLVLTNAGKRTCELGGFPGVSLVNDNGNMVGTLASRATNYTEKKLSLAPGAKVRTVVSTSNSTNFDNGQCKAGATKFRVYPPNDTGYLSVASPVDTWCPGMMISPVLAM